MELTRLHEEFTGTPAVSAGQMVLVKRRNRNVWEVGVVMPPQRINWRPGDPVDRRLTIQILQRGMTNVVVENAVHVTDPKFIHSTQYDDVGWELVSKISVLEYAGMIEALMGRLSVLEAQLKVVEETCRSQTAMISKLNAAASSHPAPARRNARMESDKELTLATS
jgi:hypothetical protein